MYASLNAIVYTCMLILVFFIAQVQSIIIPQNLMLMNAPWVHMTVQQRQHVQILMAATLVPVIQVMLEMEQIASVRTLLAFYWNTVGLGIFSNG